MPIINKPLSSIGEVEPTINLNSSLQQILMILLGKDENTCTPETLQSIQNLIQQDRVFNAFFDFSERIYESNSSHQPINLDSQSPIIQVLQKNRIVFSPVQLHESSNLSKPLTSSQVNEACQLATLNHQHDSKLTKLPELDTHQDTYKEIDTKNNEATCSIHHFITINKNDSLNVFTPYVFKPDLLKAIYLGCLDSAQNQTSTCPEISALEDAIKSTLASQPHPMPTPKVTKMPYFQIPNARVGLQYQEQIKIQNSPQQVVQLKPESVSLPDEIGIRYDSEQQAFIGTPTLSGEFPIKFDYFENDAWREGYCTFIITADPKSLWQVKEPADDQPYWKDHSAHQYIETANYHIAAASRRGRSHEHAGSFRDDDFSICTIDQSNWSVLAVADGAGSALYSREGSRIAVQMVSAILEDHIRQNIDQFDVWLDNWHEHTTELTEKSAQQQIYTSFYEVFYQATMQAIESIERVAKHHSVPAKTFATTLLVAVVKHYKNKVFVCTFWIGDGAIAVYSHKKMRLMGTPDGGEFAGQTRFLDKSITAQFDKRVNIGFFDDMQAVILMTDGISDPKFETDSGLLNQDKWDGLWSELYPVLEQEKPDECLLEWMHFFSAGHHDDRTLAVLWSSDNKVE